MRLLSWLTLVALSIVSVAMGRLSVALMLGALKAALVGLEFMELRHAARVHAAAYMLFLGVVLVALELL